MTMRLEANQKCKKPRLEVAKAIGLPVASIKQLQVLHHPTYTMDYLNIILRKLVEKT